MTARQLSRPTNHQQPREASSIATALRVPHVLGLLRIHQQPREASSIATRRCGVGGSRELPHQQPREASSIATRPGEPHRQRPVRHQQPREASSIATSRTRSLRPRSRRAAINSRARLRVSRRIKEREWYGAVDRGPSTAARGFEYRDMFSTLSTCSRPAPCRHQQPREASSIATRHASGTSRTARRHQQPREASSSIATSRHCTARRTRSAINSREGLRILRPSSTRTGLPPSTAAKGFEYFDHGRSGSERRRTHTNNSRDGLRILRPPHEQPSIAAKGFEYFDRW